MVAAIVHVETDRASRHLHQLCQHVSKMRQHTPMLRSHGGGGHTPPEVLQVEWSETQATISFAIGGCTLHASPTELVLRVEAPDKESLRRLQDLLAHRLQTIGSRDDLVVRWQQEGASETEPDQIT